MPGLRCLVLLGVLTAAASGLLGRPAHALSLLSSFAHPGSALEVVADGSLLLVAADAGGLRLVDATDPAAPLPVGSVPFPTGARGVAAGSGFAFVAANFNGLAVVDVSTPAAPGAPVFLALGGSAQDVALSGDVAFVANPSLGVQVVDVSAPLAPVLLDTIPMPFATRLAVAGDRLLVSLPSTESFGLLDISVPEAPVLLGMRSVAGGAGSDAVAVGTLLGLLGSNQITWVDGAQPATLPTVTTTPAPTASALDASGALLLLGTAGFVAGGVELLDASDLPTATPATPLSTLPLDGVSERLQVVGGLVYVAGGFGGLRIVDVSNPAAPSETASLFVGNALAVAVEGGVAYVGEEVDGLRLFDVSAPGTPVFLGTADTPGTPLALALEDGRAYVADGPSGLRIVDVADPQAPVLLGGIHSGHARDVAVRDGLVYLVDGALRVFDPANPAFPWQLSAFFPPTPATALALRWPFAYLLTSAGVEVVDVSDPAAPDHVVTIPATGDALALDGRTLYVTDADEGSFVVDVTAPAVPLVASFHPALAGIEIMRHGSLLFLLRDSGFADDLAVFDAFLPPGGFGITGLDEVDLLLPVQDVTVDTARQLVYAAAGTSGSRILDIAADLATNSCANGLDDDGDGLADHPADPGCSLPGDPSEEGDCADGVDNDADGLVDHPADPGCRNLLPGSIESPRCDDRVDNDDDGAVDFPADPECQAAWDDDEAGNSPPPACGLLGLELLVVPLLARLRRVARRRRR